MRREGLGVWKGGFCMWLLAAVLFVSLASVVKKFSLRCSELM